MAPGGFNGKDYGGGHTGLGLYKYNWSGVSGYADSYPKNADLVEGQTVTFIGKNKKFRNCKGVVGKRDNKYGRSKFPVVLEVFYKKNAGFKYETVYCSKGQLQMPIVLNDKHGQRNALLNANKATRLRKKKNKRLERLALTSVSKSV
jgi:hypothetical protein